MNDVTTKDLTQREFKVVGTRPPRPEELTKAQEWITTAATPREGAQDLLWVLLNSTEYQTKR